MVDIYTTIESLLNTNFEDISSKNYPIVKQYQSKLATAMTSGNFTDVNNYLTSNSSILKNVIVQAQVFNNISEAILKLKDYTIAVKNQINFVNFNSDQLESIKELQEENDVLVITSLVNGYETIKSIQVKQKDGSYAMVFDLSNININYSRSFNLSDIEDKTDKFWCKISYANTIVSSTIGKVLVIDDIEYLNNGDTLTLHWKNDLNTSDNFQINFIQLKKSISKKQWLIQCPPITCNPKESSIKLVFNDYKNDSPYYFENPSTVSNPITHFEKLEAPSSANYFLPINGYSYIGTDGLRHNIRNEKDALGYAVGSSWQNIDFAPTFPGLPADSSYQGIIQKDDETKLIQYKISGGFLHLRGSFKLNIDGQDGAINQSLLAALQSTNVDTTKWLKLGYLMPKLGGSNHVKPTAFSLREPSFKPQMAVGKDYQYDICVGTDGAIYVGRCTSIGATIDIYFPIDCSIPLDD